MTRREEYERELLCILLNDEDNFKDLKISYKYLSNKELSKMLKYTTECYSKNECLLISELMKNHKDFNNDLYAELIESDVFIKTNAKKKLILLQNKVFNFYKLDIAEKLNNKLLKKEIDYEEFNNQIKKLEDIKISNIEDNKIKTTKDIDMSKEEEKVFIKSNINILDKAIKGFQLGQLSVWSGGNASAKSTFLNQLAIESIEQNYKVLIYSGELTNKRLLSWILLQTAGKNNISHNEEKDYNFVNSYAKDKILDWLNNKLFLYDNAFGNKANEILDSIQECVIKENVKVVIIDNLMSMNLSSYGDAKYDVQSAFITKLSELAKAFDIHIHFVCHPRKSTNFLRKVDISGTADLGNIADNIFIMHRVNNDFITRIQEAYKGKNFSELFKFTNIIEVCKNRNDGVEDYFVGMYFEKESKRLKNEESENKIYGWQL